MKHRGIFFRPNPKGNERFGGGIRGAWWVSYVCAFGHRHREKIGSKSMALEEHASLRRKSRRESYCPNLAREAARAAIAAQPPRFDEAVNEYLEWATASKRSHVTDLQRFKALLQKFKDKRLDQISPQMVEQFKLI